MCRNDEYPAIFVSDGKIMVTLWGIKEKPETPFNKKKNVGLHHVALHVEDEVALNNIYNIMKENEVEIEF